MSHRILVIDHHPQGLQRVVDPLREAGYEVAVAHTVADGAAAFGRFKPALVFIAARLPHTHGTVLCRELKRTDAGTSTPIVLIVESAGIQIIDLPPLDQFGADRLIQKPIGADELLALCRELLEGNRKLAASDGDETGSQNPAEPDDGLNIALEELDSLEFDLPDEVVRGLLDTPPPQPPAVRLSTDRGDDIESHLEELFTEKQSPTPAPMAGPEPSTGRDNEADAAVIDELDLDNELNAKLGTDENASAPRPANPPQPPRTPGSTTPRRTAVPLASSATTTVSKPVSGSRPTAGRFQTEAFTRKRTMPQPFSVAADTKQLAGLARWSWVAIPVTVVIVFLAIFFMSRPQETQPDTGFAATPLGRGEHDAVQFRFPVDPIDETDSPTAVTEPGEDVSTKPAIETPPEVVAQKPAPADPAPQKVARVPSTPDPAPRNVTPDPVSNDPAPRIVAQVPVSSEPEPRNVKPDPVTPAAIETSKPDAVVEREPPRPQVQTVEDIPEPIVESTPPDSEPAPEPAPPVEPIREPRTLDSVSQDPASPDVVQDPITRDPILIQRVEPRVSKKDLKKGGGTVVLRIRISESGAVTRVLVDQGLPGSPLEAAAVAAVLRWRYEPALDRDEPVGAWTTAHFTFD